jgi:hypothetical protein
MDSGKPNRDHRVPRSTPHEAKQKSAYLAPYKSAAPAWSLPTNGRPSFTDQHCHEATREIARYRGKFHPAESELVDGYAPAELQGVPRHLSECRPPPERALRRHLSISRPC